MANAGLMLALIIAVLYVMAAFTNWKRHPVAAVFFVFVAVCILVGLSVVWLGQP